MTNQDNQLFGIIRAVRQRRWAVTVLRGLAICVAAFAALLILTGLGAHRYRNNAGMLISLRLVALFGVIAVIYSFIMRPLRKRVNDAQVAQLIEEKQRGLDDRLVTAVAFSAKEPRQRSKAS